MKLGEAYVLDQSFEKLYDIKERFLRGNSFQELYSFYKYIPELTNNFSKKERILLLIQQYNFALIDLSLYLDTHPTNEKALKEYLFINEELRKLKQFYAMNFEPLEIDEYSNQTNWKWATTSFPWEGDYSVEV